MILPVPVQYIWSVVLQHLSVPAILGPRIGKYSKSGKSKAIPGHNLTIGALGVFILWFCWFGFNGASTVSMEGDAIVSAGKIFVTTNLAAAVATVSCSVLSPGFVTKSLMFPCL